MEFFRNCNEKLYCERCKTETPHRRYFYKGSKKTKRPYPLLCWKCDKKNTYEIIEKIKYEWRDYLLTKEIEIKISKMIKNIKKEINHRKCFLKYMRKTDPIFFDFYIEFIKREIYSLKISYNNVLERYESIKKEKKYHYIKTYWLINNNSIIMSDNDYFNNEERIQKYNG